MRTDIDSLPFSVEDYKTTKAILEVKYGQQSEKVNTYVQNIMGLPVITEENPRKVKELYGQLRYRSQSLERLGKLEDVKENVKSTSGKLKGGSGV